METNWKLKATALFVGIVLAVYTILPTLLHVKDKRAELKKMGETLPWYYHVLPEKELNLGLDLRGGLYLELEVAVQEALRHQVDFLIGDIKRFTLSDELKDTDAVQLPAQVIRVEVEKPQHGEFRQSLVKSFGNHMFTVEKQQYEVFFSVLSEDHAEVRKQVINKLSEIKYPHSDVLFSHKEKYLCVFFASPEEKHAVLNALSDDSFNNKIEPVDYVEDVLYLTLIDDYLGQIKKNIVGQAATSVRNRIDRFGVVEANVSRQGSDRLVIELPGVKDPDRVIDIVRRTGKLEFRLVDEKFSSSELRGMVDNKKKELGITVEYQKDQLARLNEALKGDLPQDTEIIFQLKRDAKTNKVIGSVPFLLEKKAEVTGDMLDNASVQTQNNMPYVSMSFNKSGAKKFGDLTQANVGHFLAIVLDGVVMSSPRIKSAITGGQAQIELGFGRFDVLQREAQELVLILKEGALPATLTVATKNVIGPSLGHDSIRVGVKSLLIAAVVVLLFMLVYYKVGGLIANIALIVNVLFIFAILCLFQASLTLPGIAGIVLTMGMAVDANVIIFERMREEMYLGKAPQMVVDSGYDNAMSAIIDGNITTFIAGLVLFEFGTGPLKGFATTLMIGIVTTLITALVLTRVIDDWLVHSLKIKKIRI